MEIIIDSKKEYNLKVHAAHCCEKHGCKYGDKDCPVILKKINQKYPCEECDQSPWKPVTNSGIVNVKLNNINNRYSHKENNSIIVTEKMKEAGNKIASDLIDATVAKELEGLCGSKTFEEYCNTFDHDNLDLIKEYVSGTIDSVTVIYIAMERVVRGLKVN